MEPRQPSACLPRSDHPQIRGHSLGRQELEAELPDDVPGDLWTCGIIEKARVRSLSADGMSEDSNRSLSRASRRPDRRQVNHGGEMLEATLRVIDPNVSFAAVRASRDKVTRAEPVAALYEQGRVHHLGTLPPLEDQRCSFVPASHGNVDLRPAGYSPNRVDALVWAFADLLVTPMPNQGIFDLYRQLVQKSRS
jgi:phage terminase large subunit-like protein